MKYIINTDNFRNFDVAEINKLSPRAYFIPYSSMEKLCEQDVLTERYNSDMVTVLNGEWEFKYYEKDDENFESFEEEMKDKNPNFNNNNYNITLFHSPLNIYKYIEKYPNHPLNNTDLILSGHMHNGCIPYLFTKPFNKILKSSISLI